MPQMPLVIFRYEPYDPAIDVEMSSVTVRGASANIEAFTHNVDKQNTTIKRRRIGYGFI